MAPVCLVVELDQGAAGRRPGRGAFADLDDAVRDVGREVSLRHLDEGDALTVVRGVHDEACVKGRGGGDVTAAELAHGLAEVCLRAGNRRDLLGVVRDADDDPPAARVGERRDDLGDLATDGGGVLLLELEHVALVHVGELGEVLPVHVRQALGPSFFVAKRAEHPPISSVGRFLGKKYIGM